MADLTDDQRDRLREIAGCDLMELWDQDDIDALRGSLPALLDENDRLREERIDALKAMAEARRKAKDAMDRRDIEAVLALETANRLSTLTETVRDVAESLGETGSASDSLTAQILHTACDQAQGES